MASTTRTNKSSRVRFKQFVSIQLDSYCINFDLAAALWAEQICFCSVETISRKPSPNRNELEHQKRSPKGLARSGRPFSVGRVSDEEEDVGLSSSRRPADHYANVLITQHCLVFLATGNMTSNTNKRAIHRHYFCQKFAIQSPPPFFLLKSSSNESENGYELPMQVIPAGSRLHRSSARQKNSKLPRKQHTLMPFLYSTVNG